MTAIVPWTRLDEISSLGGSLEEQVSGKMESFKQSLEDRLDGVRDLLGETLTSVYAKSPPSLGEDVYTELTSHNVKRRSNARPLFVSTLRDAR